LSALVAEALEASRLRALRVDLFGLLGIAFAGDVRASDEEFLLLLLFAQLCFGGPRL